MKGLGYEEKMGYTKEIKLVTPISHLFNNYEDGIEIQSFSDQLEARERTCKLRFKNTTHYHIDFDLNLGLKESQKDFLRSHVRDRKEITNLTFQLTRDTEEFDIKNGKGFPKGNFIDRTEQLKRSKISVKEIRDIVGSDRSIGIENNNFYDTGAYEIATSSDFINQVIKETNTHLLLDIAHAKITCQNKNLNFKNYIYKLSQDISCKQIHLCGTGQRIIEGKAEIYDAHLLPTNNSIKEALHICKELEVYHLTLEYYQNKNELIGSLKQLKKMIKDFK